MYKEGVHVEFTMSGISREMFASMLGWIGEALQPFFPIVTGAWGLPKTASFTLAMIGAGLVALLIRRMLDDRSADGSGATGEILAPDIRTGAKGLPDRSPRQGALATALSGEKSPVAVTTAVAAGRSVGFISQMGLYYVVFSLAVCWLFGTGDLGVLTAFSIGG